MKQKSEQTYNKWRERVSNLSFITKKSPGANSFSGELKKEIQGRINIILHQLFQKIEEEDTLTRTLCDASITLISKLDRDVTENNITDQYSL